MAANDTILQGTDWGNAAHWGGHAARVPLDNDRAWISPALSANVTGTPDQGLIDLDYLHIPSGFTHELFTSASPLLIAADLIEHFGAGGVHIASDIGGAATKIDEFRGMCANSRVVNTLTSNPADAGDWVLICLARGTYIIGADTAFDAAAVIHVGHLGSPKTDVTLKILDGTDVLSLLNLGAGHCESHRDITTANIAGKMSQEDSVITTANILPGGWLDWNTIDSTGVLGTCTVYPGGTLNLLATMSDKAITTLNALPGSTVLMVDEIVDITTFNDWRRELD